MTKKGHSVSMGGKKRKPRLYEPITERQIWKIESLVAERPELASDELLMKIVTDLIGIPDVTALSKQEASHVIERLLGDTTWDAPPPPRTADEIGIDGDKLPSYGHIYFIRKTAGKIGWDRERFKDWLHERTGRRSIRDIDREQARKLYVIMMDILKQRN